ncbi:DUF4097 family beta strand repeat-containing protein [Streptococcus ruminantium]|uniref:DUF4097 family beta strand repeat-containing protein n=1 Tax=Streptococcus ruminantium TaxID=1917441 RepID=UPI0012DEEC91|nr:DUF4097 family beta strand repeat-containing protein [Streptococcus ruminantium]
MTRVQFLKELEVKLQPLSRKEYDEAMEYFTELFDEAGAENEDAILKDLGTPEEVAKELLSKLASTPTIIQREQSREKKSSFSQEKSDFDKEKKRIDLLDFKRLSIRFDTADLSILPTNEETAYLLCDEDSGVTIENQADLLTIRQSFNQKEIFSSNFTLKTLIQDITQQIFSDNHFQLYLPKNYQQKVLTVQLGNGDVNLENLAISGGTIQTGSGDILCKNCHLSQMNIGAGAGDIGLLSCQIDKGNLQIGSGDISLTNSQVKQLQIELASGDIDCTLSQLENLDIDCASGDMELTNCQFIGKTSLTNVSGDISFRDFHSNANTTSLYIETAFGDCDTNLTLSPNGRGFAYHAPQASAELHIQSQTGDIEIF